VSKGLRTYEDLWIPTLIVRNQGEGKSVSSRFTGVIDVYTDKPVVTSVERIPTVAGLAVKVHLSDGTQDTIFVAEGQSQDSDVMHLEGELGFIRRSPDGSVTVLALANGRSVAVGERELRLDEVTGFAEVCF
jgi:hypothetical protein